MWSLKYRSDCHFSYYYRGRNKNLTLNYNIIGKKAAQALMLITRNDDGLEARLNSSNKTLVVTFADDFEEGVTMIMLYDTEDNVLIKPMRFTFAYH